MSDIRNMSRDELATEVAALRLKVKSFQFQELTKKLADGLNAQRDTFFVFEPETGKAVYWNTAFRKVSGYCDAEIAEMKAPGCYYDDVDLAKIEQHLPTIYDGNPEPIELELITKDKRRIPTEYVASAVLDDTGKAEYLIVIGRDVRKRKLVEESLRESEEKYRMVVERANDGISIIQDGKVLFANPSTAKIFGYSQQGIIGTSLLDHVHPDERSRISQIYERRMSQEEISSIYPVKCVKKDGRPITVENNASFISYRGKPSILSIQRDISERIETHARLAESERRYRTLIENTPIVAWIADEHGNTSYISPNVENIFGYSVEEIIAGGNSFWLQRVHLDDRQAARLAHQALFARQSRFDIEYQIQHKNGRWLWFHDRASLVVQEDGRRLAYGVFTDVTRLKEQAFEKRQLEEKLRQSEKMEAVGQLAGGIAHDFNNQLASVVGYAELIGEHTQGHPGISQFVEKILTATERATDLTSQLLAFARKGKYLVKPVNMQAIITEVVSLLSRSINKNIQVTQQFDARYPWTFGDPNQLQNALLNLALNARDAMPDGGELLFLTDTQILTSEECKIGSYEIDPGSYLCVSVKDTGCGIDAKTQKHMFEPFYTTKEEGKGTGMGLAAVYGTIKNHKGAIAVESEVNRGTTLRLYLPLMENTRQPPAQSTVHPSAVTGSANILIVDDDSLFLDMAKNMIAELGYCVESCSDGLEAVRFYENQWQNIDLVILDMIMPRWGGRDAFMAMREINPDIVVLLSSGYSSNSEAQLLLKNGIKGFIQKPFRRTELSFKLAELLDVRKSKKHV